MNRQQLVEQIRKKKSFLCVGLDTDIEKIPSFLKDTVDPIFAFNKEIIDQTHDLTIAYKPNLAFYESLGIEGWKSLEKTINYLNSTYPDIFTIADAKRGDIGNTSKMYAKAFFENLKFDSVTVAPYMGEDSVSPFLDYENKWVILLALTSNKGAFDFQFHENDEGVKLFQKVINKSNDWGNIDNLMYVVGATKANMISKIRELIPQHFLLVPGVGAQGGSLEEVSAAGLTNDCGLIVNASRSIIYADNSENFGDAARKSAQEVQQEMEKQLALKNII
jgi:orotidine-5'-phosphate decarboxylase